MGQSAKTPGAGGRRWHGPEFFAFNRPDVTRGIEEAMHLPPIPFAKHREALPFSGEQTYTAAVPGTGKAGDCVKWAGILSHGRKIDSPHWLIPCGDNLGIYLRDGYVAKREVVTADGDIEVTCSIGMDDDQRPQFKISWLHETVSASTANLCCTASLQKFALPHTPEMGFSRPPVLWLAPSQG